jgi:hypothetical protein
MGKDAMKLFATYSKWLEQHRPKRNTASSQGRRYFLTLETLEERALPAPLTISSAPLLPGQSAPSTGTPAATDPGQPVVLPGTGGTANSLGQPPLSDRMTLAVADFNGDGEEDFLYGDQWRNRVSLQLSPSGTDSTWALTDGIIDPRAVATADLNGDGNLDLVVVAGGSNNVLVALGQGNGQFGPMRAFPTGDGPASVTIADLNNDGIPDLVIPNAGSNDLTILFGQGTGTAWTLTPGPRLQVGLGPRYVLAQDLNGDGNVDLLVCNHESHNVYQLNGLGGGTFDDAHPIIYDVKQAVSQVLVGSFDNLPGLDLITVNDNGLTFFFKPNFTTAPDAGRLISDGAQMPVTAVVGDFNGDGIDDLAVANEDNGSVSIMFGSAKGPQLGQQIFLNDMPHPTDLVWASDGSGYMSAARTRSKPSR